MQKHSPPTLNSFLGSQTMRILGITMVFGCIAWTTTPATADTIHVPEDFPTIQGAIDAAVDFDEIIVAAGVYNGGIDFLGKAITLHSVAGADATTISGGAPVVTCQSGEGSLTVIEGFTISAGVTDESGGGMRNINSSPTVVDCVFADNSAEDVGGAMYNVESNVMVLGCEFISNEAEFGGGCYNDGGKPQFFDCLFLQNETVDNFGHDGAGMSNIQASPLIVNCVFQENTPRNGAGGIYTCGGSPIILDCVFVENVTGAGGDGGGLVFEFGCTPTIIGCTFQDNVASTSGCGGGLYVQDSSAIVLDCTFTGNQSADGGGINIDDGAAFIIDCFLSSNEVLDNGGGLFIDGDGEPSTVINCVFSFNGALEEGGGLFNVLADSDFINCAFVGNTSGSLGGGAYNQVADLTFRHCTFTVNSAAIEGGAVFTEDRSGLTLVNSIVWESTPDPLAGPGPLNVTYSNVEGGFKGEGNIDADPLFVDPAGGDYRLAAGSPCIDAGDSTVESPCRLDLDQHLRMFDDPDTADTGVGGPPVIDMGAFEFGSTGADDCNNNTFEDACEILHSITPDCNGNGAPDDCDISSGFSTDCDGNGVPDECDPDCNDNGVADACDIANGDSADRDDNGIPDECNAVGDLNLDGVVDGGDLLILLGSWGSCPPPPFDCPADLDLDDSVGPSDLIILLGNWG